MHAIGNGYTEGPIIEANPDAVKATVTYGLEMEGSVGRISLE